jgi:hypothetical protein
MSDTAAETLTRHNIPHSCDRRVPNILNRQGTASCPMEAAVLRLDDPAEALEALEQTLAALRAKA